MTLKHAFAHRFSNGVIGRRWASYDTETNDLIKGPLEILAPFTLELPDTFEQEEINDWEAEIYTFFFELEEHLQWEQAIADSKIKAARVYPDLTRTDSPLHQKVRELMDIFHTHDFEILRDEDGPFKVAEIAAVLLDVEPLTQDDS